MATTKLTLSVETETIQKAKIFAKKRHISLSKMVQKYLQSIAEKSDSEISNAGRELSPEILALTGVIKGNFSDKDLDDMKFDYLSEKYGLK